MTRTRLTDITLRQLPFTATGQKRYWDITTPGFGVTVGKRTKTFICMTGQQRRLRTLGRYPAVSVGDARREAKVLLAVQHSPRAITRLREAILAFYDDAGSRVRPNTLKEYKRHLDKAPDKPLNDLTRHDLDLTEPHTIKAWKVFYNWCVREELTDRNPFLNLPIKHGVRSRVLSTDEIQILWNYEHRPFSDMLKLLLLTGQRRSQIWKLNPDWIDGRYITWPAEAMKAGHEHTIPIGPLALQYTQYAPFSFNSWSKAKARMDRITGLADWTVHDLRRTMVTLCASLHIPLHVTEQYVAHRTGSISGIAAVYNRHTYLREMDELALKYEHYIATLVDAQGTT